MTQEDKLWIGGGAVVAIAGGVYWYIQSQKDNNDSPSKTDNNYADSTDTGSTKTPLNPSPKTREPDTVKYEVGREVMAIGSLGTKTYEVKKMADGTYSSTGVLKATFGKGDKIGKIIWRGKLSDGTFRYVVEREGNFRNDIYWVADYRVISLLPNLIAEPKTTKPSITKPKTGTTPAAALNVNLVLKKGSKGAEVKELQKILGMKSTIAGYGTFGPQTENALIARKGVKQITLSKYGIK